MYQRGDSDIIAGRYRVEKTLSGGGMGRVVVARHLGLGERVAIKILRAEHEGTASVERFRREARAAAKLRGQHVVRVMDVGDLPDGTPYIVMEYASGRDLRRELEATGPVAPDIAVNWVLQACEALAEAHRAGIVHRDIKPGNLVLTKRPDGEALVKVLDFGIAKVGEDNLTLTGTQEMLGSPRYMSPEQVRDPRTVDARTDLWSLGVLLYELATGKLPFEAFSVPGYVARLTADPPEPPRTHRPELSEELQAVILRCLEKDPAARFQDVAELASALAPFGPDGSTEAAARVRRVLDADPALRPSDAPPPGAEGADATFATVSTTAGGAGTTRKTRVARKRRLFLPLGAALAAALGGWAFFHPNEPAQKTPAASPAPPTLPGVAPPGKPKAEEPMPTPKAVPSAEPVAVAVKPAAPVPVKSKPTPKIAAPEAPAAVPAPEPPPAPSPASTHRIDFGPRQ